jgi:hypothetical protein
MLRKDDAEQSVPEDWRSTFRQIVDAFLAGDFDLRDHPIGRVAPIDPDTARINASNIADYGDALAPLEEETWDRSVYCWAGGHWEFLVDLSTEHEKVSDLTLHAKLYEEDQDRLEVCLVYVP